MLPSAAATHTPLLSSDSWDPGPEDGEKSRPLACHLLEEEGSFQTHAVRITG